MQNPDRHSKANHTVHTVSRHFLKMGVATQTVFCGIDGGWINVSSRRKGNQFVRSARNQIMRGKLGISMGASSLPTGGSNHGALSVSLRRRARMGLTMTVTVSVFVCDWLGAGTGVNIEADGKFGCIVGVCFHGMDLCKWCGGHRDGLAGLGMDV